MPWVLLLKLFPMVCWAYKIFRSLIKVFGSVCCNFNLEIKKNEKGEKFLIKQFPQHLFA